MRNNSITCLLAVSCVLAVCLGVKGMTSFPANIRVPGGHTFAVSYFAAGFQIYRCNVSTGSWVLNRPEADLWPSKIGHDLNETRVGYHSFVDGRPTWYTVSAKDYRVTDSRVTAKAEATAPDAPNIAWVLLKTFSTEGCGPLSRVTYVQRVDTNGGTAPAGACSEGDGEYSSPYTAEYWYWVATEDEVCGSASVRTSSIFSF